MVSHHNGRTQYNIFNKIKLNDEGIAAHQGVETGIGSINYRVLSRNY